MILKNKNLLLFILTQVAIKRTKKAYDQYYFLRLDFLPAFFLYKQDCKTQQWKIDPEAPEVAESITV